MKISRLIVGIALIAWLAAGPVAAGWSSPVRLTRNAGDSAAPAVAVSGCRVHVAWIDASEFYGRVYYAASEDGGSTWSAPRVLGRHGRTSALRAHLAVDGASVHLVWEQYQRSGSLVFYRHSNNHGRSWGTKRRLSPARRTADGATLVATAGEVLVAWSGVVAGDQGLPVPRRRVYLRRSADGGRSWSKRVPLTGRSAGHFAPKLAAGETGLHLTWSRNESINGAGSGDILYRFSADAGGGWTPPERVNRTWGFNADALVPVGDDLHLLFQWISYKAAAVWYVRREGAGGWRGERRLHGGELYGSAAALAATSKELHAVWADGWTGSGALSYRRSEDGGRSWSPIRRAVRRSASLPALAAATAGECEETVHLLYSRRVGGDEEIFHRRLE